MKLFQTAQKNFALLGINPYDPSRKNQFNKNIFLYILLVVSCFTQTGAFLIFEANTFDEYTEGIYILSASILSPMAVASLAFQLKTLFKLIKRCENIFDSSKWEMMDIKVDSHRKFKLLANLTVNNFKYIIHLCLNTFSGMNVLASKELYEEVAQQAEQWSKWISIIAIKLTPLSGTILLLATSFFFYFVYDLGTDSFMLAVPMW